MRRQSRTLIYSERQFQRRFLKDYQNQLKLVAPELRAHGEFVGEKLIDFYKGYSSLPTSSSTWRSVSKDAAIQQHWQLIEPFVVPALNYFIDGLQKPVYKEGEKIEKDMKRLFMYATLGSLATGFLVGRLSVRPRR